MQICARSLMPKLCWFKYPSLYLDALIGTPKTEILSTMVSVTTRGMTWLLKCVVPLLGTHTQLNITSSPTIH